MRVLEYGVTALAALVTAFCVIAQAFTRGETHQHLVSGGWGAFIVTFLLFMAFNPDDGTDCDVDE